MDLIQLDPSVLEWRKVEDEMIAVDLRNSVYLTINASGALLWPLLARGATRPELVDALCERWELDPERARKDADAFVAWLADQNLLLTAPAS